MASSCLDLENAARFGIKLFNFPNVTSSCDDEVINNYEIMLLKEWFSNLANVCPVGMDLTWFLKVT